MSTNNKTETQRIYKERILKVLVHIQQHLDDELPLEELARIAYFSPFHFHRVFRSLVGESVKEHVRRLRLERAAMQLKSNADRSILRIALDAGYDTHESFTRAFSTMFDCSPSEYRRQRRDRIFVPIPSNAHYVADGELNDFEPIISGAFEMEVRLEEMPAMQVVFVRGVGPYQKVAHTAWEKLCNWAGPQGLLGPTTTMLGICHDDPEVTPPEKIRYDAAIVVDRPISPDGEVGLQELPAGLFAVATHRGPCETLPTTWNAVCGGWLPQSGYLLRNAPSFEIYRNFSPTTPPDQLITDIFVPIEKR